MSSEETTQLLREAIARIEKLEIELTYYKANVESLRIIIAKQNIINEKTINQIGDLIDIVGAL